MPSESAVESVGVEVAAGSGVTHEQDLSPSGIRVLIGGIGLPWLRDLDFGTQFLRRIAELEWPADVVLEDLSYSAHRVLHTLQDLRPAKVVLVCAMPRDVDPPGTIRRYQLDLTPPPGDEVADRLGEAIGGIIDLDHTLAIVRYWKGFPADTVVIEVEPEDRAFGLGFSSEIESRVDEILALVRKELVVGLADTGVAGDSRSDAVSAVAAKAEVTGTGEQSGTEEECDA